MPRSLGPLHEDPYLGVWIGGVEALGAICSHPPNQAGEPLFFLLVPRRVGHQCAAPRSQPGRTRPSIYKHPHTNARRRISRSHDRPKFSADEAATFARHIHPRRGPSYASLTPAAHVRVGEAGHPAFRDPPSMPTTASTARAAAFVCRDPLEGAFQPLCLASLPRQLV